MPPTAHPTGPPRAPRGTVLVRSPDPLAAALLGALLETLGYRVCFPEPAEGAEQSIRRTRPDVCLADCRDAEACSAEAIRSAAMRGVDTVVFGTRASLARADDLLRAHRLGSITMPARAEVVEAALEQARAPS